MRLSEQGIRKIDAFWANDLGCLPEDFHRELVAQYQTLFENEPSIAVARALEFDEYGQRMFVRCKEV
jgi:hypothetical protein